MKLTRFSSKSVTCRESRKKKEHYISHQNSPNNLAIRISWLSAASLATWARWVKTILAGGSSVPTDATLRTAPRHVETLHVLLVLVGTGTWTYWRTIQCVISWPEYPCIEILCRHSAFQSMNNLFDMKQHFLRFEKHRSSIKFGIAGIEQSLNDKSSVTIIFLFDFMWVMDSRGRHFMHKLAFVTGQR